MINKTVIIICGYRLDKNDKMSLILVNRLKKALNIYNAYITKQKTDPNNIYIIVSGGKPNPYNKKTEASVMKKWLIKHGISAHKIISEFRSKNTLENIKYSKNIIDKNGYSDIIIVSSNWHIPRIKIIANEILQNFICIGVREKITKKRLRDEKKYMIYYTL